MLAVAAAALVLAAAEPGPRPSAPNINAGGIANAASNDVRISPGAIISIYGTGLAVETRPVRPGDLNAGSLPEILAGVIVLFGNLAAPLFYVSPLQINAQVPTLLPPGEWDVSVSYSNLRSTQRVTVRPYAPGLFPVFRHPDGTLIARESPVRPGDYFLAYGTGFGPTSPMFLAGALAPENPVWMTARIEAQIAGIALAPSDIYYSGLAPGFAGLYQFNLRVPGTVPDGQQNVRIQVLGEWSQPDVKVWVSK